MILKEINLHCLYKTATFAYRNEKNMNTLMQTFSRFERLVSLLASSGNTNNDFHEICRKMRVSPYTMEEIIKEQTGLTGSEIMEIYRA